MFNELKVRKWHRIFGIVLAPLIFIQALSGLVIAFENILALHKDVTEALEKFSGELSDLVIKFAQIARVAVTLE